ncbi:hypothetical protein ACFQ1L_13530 [Phytohabitans flavus]|uniref:hypothetical protein n=1 Tax=Phytohabitans flavus TaxID=1076124 RepID=UPI0015662F78|nr:hypothetical protein [Phytohabitans flavus]
MAAFEMASLLLITVVIGGSTAIIVLAGVVLARSRRASTVRLFGRVLHHPRLWATVAVSAGAAGLLSEAREHMPSGWQEPSMNVLGVLQVAFSSLFFIHLYLQSRANRAAKARSAAPAGGQQGAQGNGVGA